MHYVLPGYWQRLIVFDTGHQRPGERGTQGVPKPTSPTSLSPATIREVGHRSCWKLVLGFSHSIDSIQY